MVVTNKKRNRHLSQSLSQELKNSVGFIQQLSLANQKKVQDFKKKVEAMHPDLQDFATIVSTELSILDEKFKILYRCIEEIYTEFGGQ